MERRSQGTCQRLEKSYFRLTAAPDPTSVRPEPVLQAALERLLRLVRGGDQKYLYLLDQFKVGRQRRPSKSPPRPVRLEDVRSASRLGLRP